MYLSEEHYTPREHAERTIAHCRDFTAAMMDVYPDGAPEHLTAYWHRIELEAYRAEETIRRLDSTHRIAA